MKGYSTGCDEERAWRSSLRRPPFFATRTSSKSESECSPPRLPFFAGGGVTGSGQPAILGCHTDGSPVSSSSFITLSTSNAVGKTLPLQFGIITSDKPAGTCTSGSHSAGNKAERWQAMFQGRSEVSERHTKALAGGTAHLLLHLSQRDSMPWALL